MDRPVSTKLLLTEDFSPHNGGMKLKNIVGPQIRRLRVARGWSQEVLLAKLHLAGFMHKDRAGLGKIESQLVYVTEYELHYFARVFEITIGELLPELCPERRVDDQLTELLKPRNNHNSAGNQRPQR
jgi:transcriptional regulator with XRE-family HTH domain